MGWQPETQPKGKPPAEKTKGAETMQRLIDADICIEKIKNLSIEYDAETVQRCIEVVSNAPTIDAEPQWIPCSERLPEYFEPVITWDGHCYSVEKRIPYIRDEAGNLIKSEWWVSDDYEEETDYYPNLRDGTAIAWMPLPEPYEVKE